MSASWGKSVNILASLSSDEVKELMNDRQKKRQDYFFAQGQLNKALISAKGSSSNGIVWMFSLFAMASLAGLLIVAARQNKWQRLHEQAREDAMNDAVLELVSDLEALSQSDLTQKVRTQDGRLELLSVKLNNGLETVRNKLKEVKNTSKEAYDLTLMVAETLTKMTNYHRQNIDDVERQSTKIIETYEISAKIDKDIKSVNYFVSEFKSVAEQGADSSTEVSEKLFTAKNRMEETSERIKRIQALIGEVQKGAQSNEEMGEELWIRGVQAAVFAAKAGEAGQGFRVISETLQDLAKLFREQARRSLNNIDNIQSDMGALSSSIHGAAADMEFVMNLVDESQGSWKNIQRASGLVIESINAWADDSEEQGKNINDLDTVNRQKLSAISLAQDVLGSADGQTKNLVEKQKELKEIIHNQFKV